MYNSYMFMQSFPEGSNLDEIMEFFYKNYQIAHTRSTPHRPSVAKYLRLTYTNRRRKIFNMAYHPKKKVEMILNMWKCFKEDYEVFEI